MKGLLLTCLLCLSISWLDAQEITVKRERVFTGTGLYGYMNGGAEQFLEYGVTKLTARDLEYDGEDMLWKSMKCQLRKMRTVFIRYMYSVASGQIR